MTSTPLIVIALVATAIAAVVNAADPKPFEELEHEIPFMRPLTVQRLDVISEAAGKHKQDVSLLVQVHSAVQFMSQLGGARPTKTRDDPVVKSAAEIWTQWQRHLERPKPRLAAFRENDPAAERAAYDALDAEWARINGAQAVQEAILDLVHSVGAILRLKEEQIRDDKEGVESVMGFLKLTLDDICPKSQPSGLLLVAMLMMAGNSFNDALITHQFPAATRAMKTNPDAILLLPMDGHLQAVLYADLLALQPVEFATQPYGLYGVLGGGRRQERHDAVDLRLLLPGASPDELRRTLIEVMDGAENFDALTRTIHDVAVSMYDGRMAAGCALDRVLTTTNEFPKMSAERLDLLTEAGMGRVATLLFVQCTIEFLTSPRTTPLDYPIMEKVAAIWEYWGQSALSEKRGAARMATRACARRLRRVLMMGEATIPDSHEEIQQILGFASNLLDGIGGGGSFSAGLLLIAMLVLADDGPLPDEWSGDQFDGTFKRTRPALQSRETGMDIRPLEPGLQALLYADLLAHQPDDVAGHRLGLTEYLGESGGKHDLQLDFQLLFPGVSSDELLKSLTPVLGTKVLSQDELEKRTHAVAVWLYRGRKTTTKLLGETLAETWQELKDANAVPANGQGFADDVLDIIHEL